MAINSMLALEQAIDCSCENAVLLGNERCEADGSGEIFSHLMPGLLECPELTSDLEVITPATAFTFADEAGQQVSERRIACDEVYLAEEVFFAGTAAEVFHVPGLDGWIIRTGQQAPVAEKLQATCVDQVMGRRDVNPLWPSCVS